MKQKARRICSIEFVKIQGPHTGNGAEAHFYQMGTCKYGIKIYTSLKLAMESYERQKLAAKHGLAPKVGKIVLAQRNNSKRFWYGYKTEKAREVSEKDQIFEKQADILLEKLRKIGLGGDFSDSNCGILGRKLVAIDFGSHSEADW